MFFYEYYWALQQIFWNLLLLNILNYFSISVVGGGVSKQEGLYCLGSGCDLPGQEKHSKLVGDISHCKYGETL